MKGRKPKPTSLHKLEGTFNVTRHGRDRRHEPQPQGDLIEPPEGLSEGARAEWDYVIQHAPKGLLKKIDRDLLLRWVRAADLLKRAEAAQDELDRRSARLPFLVRGSHGLEVSPYVNIIDKATQRLIQLSDRLGFSPVARPRISIDPVSSQDGSDGPDIWGALRRFPVIDGGKAR